MRHKPNLSASILVFLVSALEVMLSNRQMLPCPVTKGKGLGLGVLSSSGVLLFHRDLAVKMYFSAFSLYSSVPLWLNLPHSHTGDTHDRRKPPADTNLRIHR